jgi:pimeloyl-ACP methyl ester carboxylesterase
MVLGKKLSSLTLDDDDGRIAYDDTGGSGQCVVCLPGMGQMRTIYRLVVPRLKDAGLRVITLDVRGMGDSSAKWSDYSELAIASDTVALLERLGTGSATIIGNSISAGAAICICTDHPELVSRLVLVSPFVRQVPVSWWKKLAFRLALAGPWGIGSWVSYQSKSLYPASKPLDLAEYNLDLKKNLHEPGRMRAFRRMAATDHRAAESRLDKVRVPVLVVMGGADPDFPNPAVEAKLVAERLHGEEVVLPGLGHYPQAERPDEFLERVLPFLEGSRNGN